MIRKGLAILNYNRHDLTCEYTNMMIRSVPLMRKGCGDTLMFVVAVQLIFLPNLNLYGVLQCKKSPWNR